MTGPDSYYMNNLTDIDDGKYWFCWNSVKRTCGWAWERIKSLQNEVYALQSLLKKQEKQNCATNTLELRVNELQKSNNELVESMKQDKQNIASLKRDVSNEHTEWQACRDGWNKAEAENKSLREQAKKFTNQEQEVRNLIARLRVQEQKSDALETALKQIQDTAAKFIEYKPNKEHPF